VWLHKLKGRCATVGAANLIVALNELVYVAVRALLAESFSALAALLRIDHDVFTEGAVQERVVFLVFLGRLSVTLACFAQLITSQSRLALEDEGAGRIPARLPLWHVLGLLLVLSD